MVSNVLARAGLGGEFIALLALNILSNQVNWSGSFGLDNSLRATWFLFHQDIVQRRQILVGGSVESLFTSPSLQ